MKKLNSSLKLILLLLLVLAFALSGCSSKAEKTDESAEAAAAVYKVAMEPTFPPFDTTDPQTGELTGFDYDMMNAIAADQGFELEWVNMGFDGLIPALQAGNIDIIASGMDARPDRREKVDFSTTYYDSGLVVAVKADNTTITGMDSLTADMKVGGQIGTSGGDQAQKLADEGKVAEAKIYNGLDVAFMDLQNGTIQAIINDKPVTEAYILAKPDTIKIVGDILNSESYGYAVKKGNAELLDKINQGMQNLKDKGELQAIYEKWGLTLED
ncbi:MAG TPA: basic amino acid ABC transporter substrate-binding protein [Clostridiales bacterium]|jgi:ABC-type amino acid transport substrate-binding protein|nr:basic amino acid ABC transporter substrate-binding protein [Clostridiales bacterium]